MTHRERYRDDYVECETSSRRDRESMRANSRKGRPAHRENEQEQAHDGAPNSRRVEEVQLGLSVLHDRKGARYDIVAVHGLGASPAVAWTWLPKNNPRHGKGYPDKPFNWLKELLANDLECRILTFNYNSKWISRDRVPHQQLSDISRNFLSGLRDIRDTVLKPNLACLNFAYIGQDEARNRPLFFIGHSFGGIIIEHALVSATRYGSRYLGTAQCTAGVIFLGTPFRGSAMAMLGRQAVSIVPSFMGDTDGELLKTVEIQSEMMKDCLTDFACWLFSESIPAVCAFEKLETDYLRRTHIPGIIRPKCLIVPAHSACIDGHRSIALDTDHSKINKFYGAKDPSYKYILDAIRILADGAGQALLRRQKSKVIPINETFTSGQLKQCLQDMRVRSPQYILDDMERKRGKRVSQTCKWIFQRKEFCSWSTSADGPRFLRLIGPPGSGKSVMSIFLTKMLKERSEKSHRGAFIYFFCDDKDSERQTPSSIIRSLIWQILVQKNELFPVIQADYEQHTRKRVFEKLFNDFSALWAIFRRLLQQSGMEHVIILIDALDECERSTRKELLVSIRSLFENLPSTALGKVRLLTTCRENVSDIEDELKSIGARLQLDSSAIKEDLDTYICAKVDELQRRKDYSPELKDAVSTTLKKNAGGTFLWVSLMVAELERPRARKADVLEILGSLPSTLDEIYAAILGRIEDHQEEVGFFLRCLVATRRPMTVVEMTTALTVWKTGTSENMSIYNDMISICSSIVCVSSDGDSATVNFCHQSVKDFLLKEPPSTRPWYCTTVNDANWCLFEICWRYMTAGGFAAHLFPPEPSFMSTNQQLAWEQHQASERQPLFKTHFLLEYAYQHWGEHASLCRDLGQHWKGMTSDLSLEPILRDNLLLSAIGHRDTVLLKMLLEFGANIEFRHGTGETPLIYAAFLGHENTIRVLLQFGADVEAMNELNLSPLKVAASWNYPSIMTLLLDNGAKVDAKDAYNNTALIIVAACNEATHWGAVRVLIDREADLEATDSLDMTPLHWVTIKGNCIMELLIDRGANIEAKAWQNLTPLCFAAVSGENALLRHLLKAGAKVDAKTTEDQTPLHLAAQYDKEEAVSVLLEWEAEVNCKDQDGWTPLCWAAFNGNTKIIRLLIERGADVNVETREGGTPLRIARAEKEADAVQVLFDNGADNSVYSGVPNFKEILKAE